MPAFNTAQYVARAVASALNQSFSDIELIVIDDGSTDDTLAIVTRLAAADSRLVVLSQANSGVGQARNRAIAEARSLYIALLDSDDEWMPRYLERQMRTLAEHPDCAVVTTNAFNRGGPFDGLPYWSHVRDTEVLTLQTMVEHEDSVCIMSVFRRDMHEAIGGYDASFTGGSEDYDFWLRAAAAGFGVVRTAAPLAFYQRRPDSMSARPIPMLNGITNALRKLRDSLGDRQPAVSAAIDRKLALYQQERLTTEAKQALRQHDYGTAADRFNELHLRHGGARLGLLAAWSRLAPSSLAWVDDIRRSRRPVVR